MAGGMLKVTLKARGDAGEAAAPAKRAKSWHEPGWAEQFKGLAPPPPRPVARARLPAGSYVPEKTRPTSKTAASELEWETYSEEERAFRVELAAFLGMRPVELYSPVFCNRPLPMRRVYKAVLDRGGYDVVCREKLWMRVCASLGYNLSGQTSASFSMRKNYERTGMLELERARAGAPAMEGTD